VNKGRVGSEGQAARLRTGIDGLDEVLAGGFARDRLYLIEGVPGSGKTTMAIQFLMDGARNGEPVMFITLAETEDELRDAAQSHGFDLGGIHLHELVVSETALAADEQYTMFHPSEVELGEATRAILAEVDRVLPVRVVLDSLSEVRLLAGTSLRYRRQILALKQYFARKQSTVLLLDDLTQVGDDDFQMQSLAHGVIRLEQLNPEYGAERRRLRVIKYRGSTYLGGYHDYVIRRGGLQVFPRLRARHHPVNRPSGTVASGIVALDKLLGGGLEHGVSTLIIGAAGTGKSTIAARFCVAAAERGDRAAMFVFDESVQTLLSRCAGVGIDLAQQRDAGRVTIQQVDPAELSPGELGHVIRAAVEEGGVRVIVLDSLNGYLAAMPEEHFLIAQLHELLAYLSQFGVATILVAAHQGLIGSAMQAPVDASYLADVVILLRYFEAMGEVRQAISVVKNRGGVHERTIREFRMHAGGISLGEPLRNFRGVLTGVPTIVAGEEPPGNLPR
jgi:circadian clock protein KaiC